MRQTRYYIPPDETVAEKELRLQREETWKWNHEYWSDHNREFFEVRKPSFSMGLMSLELWYNFYT
jgi:hypothetical protein